MLNYAVFIGRVTSEPELKKSKDDMLFCNFQLAVNRNGEGADFPEFFCNNVIAENFCKYVHKGDLVCVSARFQTKVLDGKKYHDFMVKELFFLERKQLDNYDDVEIPT